MSTARPRRSLIFIRADYAVRRREYCDHFVTTCVCVWGGCQYVGGCVGVGVYVSTIKRKPLIGMT